MHRSLHMEPSLCTGCLQCEMACSFEHEGEFNPARSRIRVFEFEHVLGLIVDGTAQSWKRIRFGGHNPSSFILLRITNIQDKVGPIPFFLCWWSRMLLFILVFTSATNSSSSSSSSNHDLILNIMNIGSDLVIISGGLIQHECGSSF